jgi:type III restriction enzyme
VAGQDQAPDFTKPEEQQVAKIAWDVIRKMGNQPE